MIKDLVKIKPKSYIKNQSLNFKLQEETECWKTISPILWTDNNSVIVVARSRWMKAAQGSNDGLLIIKETEILSSLNHQKNYDDAGERPP